MNFWSKDKIVPVLAGGLIICGAALMGCGESEAEGYQDREGNQEEVNNQHEQEDNQEEANQEEGRERPEGSHDMISDEHLKVLQDVGATIYFGSDPPHVSGTFRADNLVTIADDSGRPAGFDEIATYYFTFESGDSDEEVTFTATAPEVDHYIEGVVGYMSGSGECFTMFATTTDQLGESCTTHALELVSGCLETEGIRDLQNVFVVLEVEGDCDYGVGFRVIVEDEMARKE